MAELAASAVALLAAYMCGQRLTTSRGAAVLAALALGIQVALGFDQAPNAEILFILLPAWWAGRELRRRRVLVAQLARRTRDLEAEEETFVELSVQRERARIARDLHDIVSHHLAVAVIQAGAGRLADPWRSDEARRRLAMIREAGEQALLEAGRLVTMLQVDDAHAPGLAGLLERSGAAGARVVVTPDLPALPPAVEVAAYRVVQEALTNAMKHAAGATSDIRIATVDGMLEILVHNDGGARPSPSTLARTGSGLGLSGMRERVAMLSGTLDAGPDGHGGFTLRARLPLAAADVQA